jgi:energy-coupling factor transport system substrate-specific component
MNELYVMWRNTRMIVLTAICAAAYVAVLLPFKGFVIIPGLTEVRPGAAIPIVLSFLFGPAAAWGSGFGNIIADALGGMLGPGSIFGFLGNFFYGYLPYALWRAFMGYRNPFHTGVMGLMLIVVILVANCLVIGSIIGWGADLLRLAPFGALGPIIVVNNLIASLVLSSILLALLYERVGRWGLLYYQILDEIGEDFFTTPSHNTQPHPRKTAKIGALLCIAGGALSFLAGMMISGEALQAANSTSSLTDASKGSAAVAVGMSPGLLLIILGSMLL